MVAVTLTARGPRSADEVWERYARPAVWSEWAPQITGVDCSAQRLAAGVTGSVHGPLGVRARFEVDEWDETARRWRWHASSGPVRLRLTHTVATDGGAGVATGLTVDGAAPFVLAYLPVARYALHRLVH